MISPARQTSFTILSRIESRNCFSDDLLNSKLLEKMESRDRNLTTEIVYGTLRWQSTLDHILAKFSSRSWHDVDIEVKILLRISLYQMWQMDRIPDHALVNDAVEIGKQRLKQGVDRYLNGILRHLTRTRPWEEIKNIQEAPEWIQVSLPQWLWQRWVSRYGNIRARSYALSLNIPPRAALRLESTCALNTIPFNVYPSDIVPSAYLRSEEGISTDTGIQVSLPFQDEASQLIPHVLGDIDGRKVWDACAAPGGKTAVLCNNSGNTGQVVASDRNWKRLQLLLNFMREKKQRKADIIVADAREPAPFKRSFDAVIADVPCSGLGTLRRNPEIKWRFRKSDFSQLQGNQLNILRSVSNSVRIGGKLLYSTCSTEPEENEQVIEKFLEENPNFYIEAPVTPDGIHVWTGKDKMIRTFPSTRLWDGLFAALMVRCT